MKLERNFHKKMLTSYEQIKVERRKGIFKIIILFIICILSLSLSIFIIHQNGNKNIILAEDRRDHPRFLQIQNTSMTARLMEPGNGEFSARELFRTSIAFYNIFGNDQKFKEGEDCRGNYWEFQLNDYTGVTNVTYVTNGPLTINNKTVLVLTDGGLTTDDRQFCQRTPNTWHHFMNNYPNHRWYFRGTHDTFVNFKYLMELIQELEKKYDPMTQYAMAYNCHEYGHRLYPHGGTGYLFSNYAIKQFLAKEHDFRRICSYSADDVALHDFLNQLGEPVEKWMTNKFIVTWPNTETDIIMKKQYYKVKNCPKAYRLYSEATPMLPCPCRTAASIHMHRIPMNKAWEILQNTPENFAVTFINPDTPTFCKM